ncbi:hexameric tyrosine-coordinated heme protein [Citreimonas salinaria]|uniref:Hexameric tyrosine-coordinated heme protein (HTHP) n=1 Tax=Citreimonas salinaria TaxID=321339 RepID=A0A1H3NRJ4_9RHOB|nr:hexameric tyrosine-coordinated heme protein [Citreimonas salinaria]SDY91546.1 Hexameric tyrosine-coordinated heme protein (HTHP) [Citreimonas salinaria]
MIRQFLAPTLVGLLAMASPSIAQEETESWLPSLVTETPEEGFDLAISMARKAVTTTQTDTEVLHALRPNYSRDPESLIDVSGVVASYFATIAEANDFWRD